MKNYESIVVSMVSILKFEYDNELEKPFTKCPNRSYANTSHRKEKKNKLVFTETTQRKTLHHTGSSFSTAHNSISPVDDIMARCHDAMRLDWICRTLLCK